MAGDGYCGGGKGPLQLSVDGENAVDAARLQETRVFGDQVFSVPVVGGEEEISLLHEDVGGTAEDLGMVSLSEFGEENADGLCLESLEGARDEAGLIAELLRRGFYSFARGGGGSNGQVRCSKQRRRSPDSSPDVRRASSD